MVLDGSKRGFKTLSINAFLGCKQWDFNKTAGQEWFAIIKSNGNATFIKVTIPNIVADDLLEF
jgi:hypothetical protein